MRWGLVGCRWQEVWRFWRGLGVVWWEIWRGSGVRVRRFGRSHRTEIATLVACRTGCIRMMARVISSNTVMIRSISCDCPISSEPVSFVMWAICRALPRMLILLRLLRHRDTGVLRAIRTSKWREGTRTRIARVVIMMVVQRQRLVVVAASSGFDGSAEDVCESRSLALEVFSGTASEEGD